MDLELDSKAREPEDVLRDGVADSAPLIDPFGRQVTYMRVSVTDRCDFRCVYCMSEHMTFLPKKEVLSLEELETVCTSFVRRGVKRLRLTGGEPLVRRGLMGLITNLSRHLETGALEELTLTTVDNYPFLFWESVSGASFYVIWQSNSADADFEHTGTTSETIPASFPACLSQICVTE